MIYLPLKQTNKPTVVLFVTLSTEQESEGRYLSYCIPAVLCLWLLIAPPHLWKIRAPALCVFSQ